MSGAVLIAFLLGVFLWMLGGVIVGDVARVFRICAVIAVGVALVLAVLPLVHTA